MNYNCVICNFEIVNLEPSLTKDRPESGMYDGGVVDKISAGYGSRLDGNMHIIAICDNCLNEKTLAGITPFVGDYMMPDVKEYTPLRND